MRHLVHVSAIGADPKSPSRYARSKAAGEAAVLEEFPGAIILRPSIVFGPEDQFFNRFAAMARVSPLLPLIGGGRTRFQPVFVGDLAAAVAAIAAGAGKPGTIYELGGPEVLSFRELLDLTQEWTGRSRGYLRDAVLARQAAGAAHLAAAQQPATRSPSIRCACSSATTSSARRQRAKAARLPASASHPRTASPLSCRRTWSASAPAVSSPATAHEPHRYKKAPACAGASRSRLDAGAR